jgi:hypothetical protein
VIDKCTYFYFVEVYFLIKLRCKLHLGQQLLIGALEAGILGQADAPAKKVKNRRGSECIQGSTSILNAARVNRSTEIPPWFTSYVMFVGKECLGF